MENMHNDLRVQRANDHVYRPIAFESCHSYS